MKGETINGWNGETNIGETQTGETSDGETHMGEIRETHTRVIGQSSAWKSSNMVFLREFVWDCVFHRSRSFLTIPQTI